MYLKSNEYYQMITAFTAGIIISSLIQSGCPSTLLKIMDRFAFAKPVDPKKTTDVETQTDKISRQSSFDVLESPRDKLTGDTEEAKHYFAEEDAPKQSGVVPTTQSTVGIFGHVWSLFSSSTAIASNKNETASSSTVSNTH